MNRLIRSFSSYSSCTDCILKHLDGSLSGISVMTLSRPNVKNALGKQLVHEMQQHLDYLKNFKSCRVLVINSSTDKIFCAGADLKERVSMKQEDIAPFVKLLRDTFTNIERLPFPVIVAIDGAALGGGLELALAADLRIASEDSQLGLPETKLAIIPA